MTIAEKLTAIAENEQRVYDTGYMRGSNDGYVQGEQNGYAVGFDEGKKAEYDRFWNAYQQNGARRNYIQIFSGVAWDDNTYNPKYEITLGAGNTANSMYAYNGITTTKVPIIFNGGASNLVFYSCGSLKTIVSIYVPVNQSYNSWFAGCKSLTDITFAEGSVIGETINLQDCPLTKASITNVVNILSSSATGKTATFKKTAKEAAFTDAEWSALIATKSNWTFSLV